MPFDRDLHGGQDVFARERLGQVRHHAGLHADLRWDGPVGRDQYDRGCRKLRANSAREPEPGFSRHHHIAQDDVRDRELHVLERRCRRRRLPHLVARGADPPRQQISNLALVVDD